MKYIAALKTDSGDAKNISSALNVDNIKQEKIKIKSAYKGKTIETVVESDSLRTVASTLDDLLCCQMAAEKLIKNKKQ